MREIKFRYVYQHEETGNIVTQIFTLDEIEAGVAKFFALKNPRYNCIGRDEYTGAKDKNGAEVYEKDIIRIDGMGVGVVDYEEGRFAMHRKEERFCWPVYCRVDHSPFIPEVIGNIYENPQLLESGVTA